MTHKLKLDIEYCNAVYSGEKTFEIRMNDRGYQKGDHIIFESKEGIYHANHPIDNKEYEITYVLPYNGLKDGYVAFGIKEIDK